MTVAPSPKSEGAGMLLVGVRHLGGGESVKVGKLGVNVFVEKDNGERARKGFLFIRREWEKG